MGYEKRSEVQGPYPYRSRARNFLGWKNGSWSLSSTGEMASTNHFPLNTGGDDGGPWLMSKFDDTCVPGSINTDLYQGMWTVGNPQYPQSGATLPTVPSETQVRGYGTTAIARSAPTNPEFSLATALGELREGLPSIIGSSTLKNRTQVARSAGNEYLNVEFGWKPLVSDLKQLATAVNESHDTWAAYRKGSDQKTRVGYHFPEESDFITYSGNISPVPLDLGTPYGFASGTFIRQSSSKTWFSGAFRYHVPEPTGFAGKMGYWKSQASKILGVRLTPDVVWNLSPWTWAADWFANTGDLMTNVSNLGTDGLVLQYGYAMSEQFEKTVATGRIAGTVSSRTRLAKRCRRVPANPYGFSATLNTLTSRQLAVIAALGLSRT